MNNLENKEIELLADFDDVLTVAEMKQVLKIGRNKCYYLLSTGTIPSKRIGRNYRIPKINIINYLKNAQ